MTNKSLRSERKLPCSRLYSEEIKNETGEWMHKGPTTRSLSLIRGHVLNDNVTEPLL